MTGVQTCALPISLEKNTNESSITWRKYYYAGGQRIAMRVAEMPVSQPQPTPTPQPYPAPTPTQSAYKESFFNRFVTFLKDLFNVKTVSASPLTVDAPVGEVYFLLGDHLGSTTMTLNLDGSIKSEIRYSAWGETRYTSGATPTERHYTGQIEEEAGLYFYNARWYDSSLSRFIQADTIIPQPSSTLGWDRYAYSRNNPISYTDPSGHFAWLAIGAIGGAIGGAIYGYGSQVLSNLNKDMDLGQALTTNIDGRKIVQDTVAGAMIGTAVGGVAAAAEAIIGGLMAANTACGGDICADETVKVIQDVQNASTTAKSTIDTLLSNSEPVRINANEAIYRVPQNANEALRQFGNIIDTQVVHANDALTRFWAQTPLGGNAQFRPISSLPSTPVIELFNIPGYIEKIKIHFFGE
mgnify:FL=1